MNLLNVVHTFLPVTIINLYWELLTIIMPHNAAPNNMTHYANWCTYWHMWELCAAWQGFVLYFLIYMLLYICMKTWLKMVESCYLISTCNVTKVIISLYISRWKCVVDTDICIMNGTPTQLIFVVNFAKVILLYSKDQTWLLNVCSCFFKNYTFILNSRGKLGGLSWKQSSMWENFNEFPNTKWRKYPQYASEWRCVIMCKSNRSFIPANDYSEFI